MNELALFPGLGTYLATELLGWRTVAAVEKNKYCRNVAIQRQLDGVLPWFPIWDDVCTFNGKPFSGSVDIITAGFPCQPFSIVGKRKGQADKRNLWPDTLRIVNEVRPGWVLLENVPGLLTIRDGGGRYYFGRILQDLFQSGYNARWSIISAKDLGAPHLRKRVWIMAHAFSGGPQITKGCGKLYELCSDRETCNKTCRPSEVENANNTGRTQQRFKESVTKENLSAKCTNWWKAEPAVGRMVDGVADRIQRITALGNGWVPQVAVRAVLELSELGKEGAK